MLFEDILKPISTANFLQDSWGVSPSLIEGHSEKFDSLPSINEFPALIGGNINNGVWENAAAFLAQAYFVDSEGKQKRLQNIGPEIYTQLFNQGYGLCFGDISSSSFHFKELLDDISKMGGTNQGLSITAYLTPPNSQGILHFDHQHVFFLQVSGKKSWRHSQLPAVDKPLQNLVFPDIDKAFLDAMHSKGYDIKVPNECGHVDITLSKGDVLYMPPGHYHVGRTTDECSLHYTLTLEPVSVFTNVFSYLHSNSFGHSHTLNSDTRFLSSKDQETILNAGISSLKEMVDQLKCADLTKTKKE